MIQTVDIAEIEKCLLACFLMGTEIPAGLHESMFYDNRHGYSFSALAYLYGKGHKPDLIMLKNQLCETGKLDAAGGVSYIASFTNTLPSSANVKYYLDTVIEQSETRRKETALKLAFEKLDKEPVDEIIAEFQKSVNETGVQRGRKTSWTVKELLEHEFPPIKWMIPELVAPGLSIVVGAPKIGKSWLALSMAYAVATGGHMFGSIPVGKYDVLYLSLEDVGRRLKDRLLKIGASRITNLRLEERWTAGIAGIRHYVQQHPTVKLVIIDTWAQFFPKGDFNDYSEMSKRASSLKAASDDLDISIVVTHHTRKGLPEGSDWTDASLGSQGLVGSADSIIMLRRGRGESEAELRATGRDIAEKHLVLNFDNDRAMWTIVGDKNEIQDSETRQLVYDWLKETPGGHSPKAIWEGIREQGYKGKLSSIQTIVNKMAAADSIRKTAKGVYGLPVPVFEAKTDCKYGATDTIGATPITGQSIVPEEELEIF